MSHLKADSDGSINLDWILAIGFDNRLIFSFTNAAGSAADISGVTSFTLEVWKEGSPTNIFQLTESAGNLIRGTGELEAVIGVNNSDLLKNKGEYLWQMSVVYPGPTRSRWYNGTIFASSGIHTNTITNSTATINIGGVTVTASTTITIAGLSQAEADLLYEPIGGGGGAWGGITGTLSAQTDLFSALGLSEVSAQTLDFTFALTDLFRTVPVNAATSKTGTVPLNSSVAFPIGTVIGVKWQTGAAGQPAVAAAGGVTINNTAGNLLVPAVNVTSCLIKTGTDTWTFFNGIAGSAGSGDVVGPASAVADRIAVFDSTTGKLIKDGGVTVAGLQPIDADLTAIAALSSAADKLPYATGAQAWALTDLSSFIRTLLDDATAGDARTTLGIGTNTFTITLGSLGLSPADSTTYYFSGIGLNVFIPDTFDTRHAFTTPNFAFTIIGVVIQAGLNTVQGGTEASTLQLRNLTAATSTSIGTFLTNGTSTQMVCTTIDGLSIAVPASQSITMRWDTPAWATNPTNVRVSVMLICTRP